MVDPPLPAVNDRERTSRPPIRRRVEDARRSTNGAAPPAPHPAAAPPGASPEAAAWAARADELGG